MRNVEVLARDEPEIVIAALLCDKDGSCAACPATGFCAGADARADREWLMAEPGGEGQAHTCGSCDHSRIELHTGDERRVCWYWRSFGHIVEDGHFCGYWQPAEPWQKDGAAGAARVPGHLRGIQDDDVSQPLYRLGS